MCLALRKPDLSGERPGCQTNPAADAQLRIALQSTVQLALCLEGTINHTSDPGQIQLCPRTISPDLADQSRPNAILGPDLNRLVAIF